MLELTYPNTSLDRDWFVTKSARHTLWRWLFISLALHVFVLMGWELSHLAQTNAVLPIQSGRQAVDVQLVSAPTQQQKANDQHRVITVANKVSEVAVQPQPVTHKTIVKKENEQVATQNTNNTNATVSTAANLTEGVYSEATPQSSHKPEYPRMAILKNQQGKVVIKLEIDENGQSHNIQLLKSSGFALLDNAVITFAQMEKFIPAIRNNLPIKTTQQYSFLFKLI